ncbi:hypothetical protein DRE_01320 [Drechslerella stenobrocha 248]|uniref:Homeobox domain-containing protein n=1 Tax=Drechslerella stenobrocha 248 TaxID=1043628 RepID=W7HVS2_9PEZI|nr:hypothetical protein DRE_01320 [Drechslerella stenobrocha 248]
MANRPDQSSAQHINLPRPSATAPHIESFIGTHYNVPRFTPPVSGPSDEAIKETRRFKCSREQTLALERLYQQCPKPNQATKRDLAHAINLSPTRVNIWFQNRRHRAKKHKEIQEAKMAKILETAGRKRMAKIAMEGPSSLGDSSDMETPTSATSSQPSLPLLTTEFKPLGPVTHHTQYSSPKEAAAASLARSLAMASAYAVNFSPDGDGVVSHEYHPPTGPYDGTPPANYSLDPYHPNFYPVSTFSDWGSGYSSVAYTPAPAGQTEDPFEYDKLSNLNSPYHNTQMSNLPPVFHDDYSAFAAAVQMNTMPKAMNMNLKSKEPVPNGLVLRNNSDEERPLLPRMATCPDLSGLEALSMQHSRPMQTSSEASSPVLEHGSKLFASQMERSQSYSDRPTLQQEIALRRLRPIPPALGANTKAQRMFSNRASVPHSPLRPDQCTPLPTPPSDADFANAAMRHNLNRKPSDLSKEHSPDVPDLESDGGFTNCEEIPTKRNLGSPPPTPETAGLAQLAPSLMKEESQEHQFTSFTNMLEQNSPVMASTGFSEHPNQQPSVESWINGHPQQQYWSQEHPNHHHHHHHHGDARMSFDVPSIDVTHLPPLAFGMQNGRQQN